MKASGARTLRYYVETAHGEPDPEAGLSLKRHFNTDTPMLLIPEAAAKGCKHGVTSELTCNEAMLEVCTTCGSHRWNNTIWHRPRLLKVSR